ncbi:hypothetical protein [Xenorhabdus budapestensis]|uniref:Uncharacterized protein n=1 Tax=Xenorhabdus budapestensis TaxID=290110 RepID=A0A2D0J2E8_XENBU|nr:hypothetical protein [Xenorhabdus budapestensis]PHM28312.1 hypothetical protein Xbud_01714 [Xenorhabdus budapestensis]
MKIMIEGEIEILDVWGEGRIIDCLSRKYPCKAWEEDLHVTGFPNAINVNHKDQKISNGPDEKKDIPNLSPVDSYDYPKFNIPDGSCKYITLMGSPLNDETMKEMIRVFNKQPRHGGIFLYGLDIDVTSKFERLLNEIGNIPRKYKVIHHKTDVISKLIPPFNEIKLLTTHHVDVFAIHHRVPGDEL